MKNRLLQITALILLVSPILAKAQVAPNKAVGGFMDFNVYRDSRDFNVMTVNLLADIADRYQYFGFFHYDHGIEAPQATDEDALYYTEQNLRWRIDDAGIFSASLQGVFQSGEDNDIGRAGVLVNIARISDFQPFFEKYNLALGVNIFPLQVDDFDGYNWQMEYFYNILIAPETMGSRLYLSGFADQNIGPDDTKWVTENQLGFRVYENFFLVAEYRLNEFMDEESGLATGVQFFLPF